jgi:hypothetical protein
MILTPFNPWHLREIDVQAAQREHYEAAGPNLAGPAWSAFVNGKPIASAGVIEMWPGRGYAWALLSQGAGPYMLALTRAIRSRLDGLGFTRLEMAVDADFPAGIRWARMLGFECETPEPMRAYSPSGRAAYLFARIV